MTDLPAGLHGAFGRADLIRLIGLPAVRAKLRTGALVRYSRSVLVDRSRQAELSTRAAAALLYAGPGAALTTHTTALLHGCAAADAGLVHVLSGYDRKVLRRPGLALHQTVFDESEVLELDGLRTVGLEFAIAELLCTANRAVALACADQALAFLDAPFRELFRAKVSERLDTRVDARGIRRAETLLRLATGLPESPAESRMLLALYDAGLPMPTPQFSVRDLDGNERYRLDFAWEQPRIALEYDGYEAHEGRQFLDAARDADLRARGWVVVRAHAPDLRRPARVVQAVRAEFAKRRFVA
jgi:hypothetical protein